MSTIKTNQLAHTANGASVYTLPQTDGSAGQVLKTDGSGNLSWVTPGTSMIDTYNLSSSVNMTGAQWNYLKTNFSQKLKKIFRGKKATFYPSNPHSDGGFSHFFQEKN